MIREIGLVALVAAPSAFAIGMWTAEKNAPLETVAAVRQNAPLVTRPGWGVESSAKYFSKSNVPPPPPPPIAAAPPPPPPPPDISVLLRRDVSAVFSEGDPQPRLILTGARRLRPGEVYRDGWVLSGVSGQFATLRRGGETRQVNLFAPVAEAASTSARATAAPAASLAGALTNTQRAGRMSSGQINQLISMLRQTGTAETQLTQLRQALQTSTAVNLGQILQLVQQIARSGRVPQIQLTQFIESLARSGVIPQAQVGILSQMAQQTSAQNPQLNQVIQQINRGGQQGGAAGRGGQGGAAPLPFIVGAPQGGGGGFTAFVNGQPVVIPAAPQGAGQNNFQFDPGQFGRGGGNNRRGGNQGN